MISMTHAPILQRMIIAQNTQRKCQFNAEGRANFAVGLINKLIQSSFRFQSFL